MSEFFANMDTLGAIGIVGVSLYIINYTALQTGFIRGQGYLYPAICLVAAACVLASLMQNWNFSSALIQITWIVISLVGITRMYVINAGLHFSDQEQLFMGDVLSGLPRHRARALLDTGIWMTALPGTALTHEGRPVDHLCYLVSGTADIVVGNKAIATSGVGTVIGDVTYLSGAPATATVIVTEHMHFLRFEADKLRAFLKKNEDIRAILEQNLANQLRTKLTANSQSSTLPPLTCKPEQVGA